MGGKVATLALPNSEVSLCQLRDLITRAIRWWIHVIRLFDHHERYALPFLFAGKMSLVDPISET